MNFDPADPSARRPLKTRDVKLFQALARRLARAGVTPNAISAASMVFGIGAGAVLAATAVVPEHGGAVRVLSFAAAALIQLRLLCNMIDGLVAVECGKKTPSGELWNEVPDRISDVATLLGAGIAAGMTGLGWTVSALALLTAYVRALGAGVGAGQVFAGPGAKPQRMAVCTGGALLTAIWPHPHACWRLALIAAGILAAATVFIRLRVIAESLANRQP